jgi:hypothetical protein
MARPWWATRTPGASRRWGGAALLVGVVLGSPPATAAEGCAPASPAQGRTESARYVLLFDPRPGPIAVGRDVSLEIRVCPRVGALAPRGLRVDAVMPAHRHGMNYRASITPRGDGRFLAQGLVFHMPGHWQLLFDVESAAGSERLAADLVLE